MPSTLPSIPARFVRMLPAGAAALVLSLQIAICAAAPEFIWQGLLAALNHPSWGDLLSALLIGLNLAFFVEPAMERVRDLLHGTGHQHPSGRRHNVLFRASLSFAFAVTSVCLHDAMVAFVSGRGAENAANNSALVAGVLLIAGWAIVPFAVALAWQSIGCRRLAGFMGIVGSASPLVAGWLFSWSPQTTISTAIPSLLILGFGYRGVIKKPEAQSLAPCTKVVAIVGTIWLTIALPFDVSNRIYGREYLNLYSLSSFLLM